MNATPASQKVNELLKSRREQKRASLQAIHQETKISVAYLEALEAGNWNAFPAEVYCMGFLRRYSAYLGLNSEEMVQLYRKELDAVKSGQEEKIKEEIQVKEKQKSNDLTRGVVLVTLILVLGSWWLYTVTRSSSSRPAPKPEEDRRIEMLPLKKKHPHSSQADLGPLSLNARATAPLWVRIVTDKKLAFEGFLSSGATRSWEAQNEILIRMGNVNDLELSLNGKPVDPRPGAVKDVNEMLLTRQFLTEEKPENSTEPSVSSRSYVPRSEVNSPADDKPTLSNTQ